MAKPERASEQHEKEFRATFRLRDEVKDELYWQAAYEYAAQYKLTIDELNSVGSVLVRKESDG